jgi:hypothetical protein
MTSSEQGQDILPYDCKNNYSMNELEIWSWAPVQNIAG